jgi:dolichol-phosphate mannosyltransferase
VGERIMSDYKLSVVVPVYKEEANITPFVERMEKVMEELGCRYEIIFCLDPSPDRTFDVIKEHIGANDNIKLVQFSRRFGQPTATLAGIHASEGDACVIIDVDLQDPPELIGDMVQKWQEGYDVVYARRRSRKGETAIKRAIAGTGYWLINKYSEVSIPVNTGDFRLIDRKVADELSGNREHHGFLRGMVAGVGFRQTEVLYDRDERASGKGNYNPFTGSWRIGLNGLFCYSYMPIGFMTAFGAVFMFISTILLLFSVFQFLFRGVSTLPLSVTVIMFIGAIQIFFIAMLGEYISRIYEEIKHRPKYIVDLTENLNETQKENMDRMRRF